MAPKKVKSDTGQGKRKVVRKTIEVKKEIIAKHENGVRVSDYYIITVQCCFVIKFTSVMFFVLFTLLCFIYYMIYI